MPAQEKLSQTEQILAYIIGGGIALAVIALFLYGLGVVDSDVALSVLLVGLAVTVIGTGTWLYLLRPWKSFDDLKTPLYTGHHDEAHTDAAVPAAPPATAQPHVEPSAMPVDRTAPAETPSDTLAAETPPAAAAAAPPAEVVSEDVAPAATPAEPAAEEAVEGAEPEPDPETPADVFAEETPPEPAPDAEPDDLTVIEGVGPKSAQALNASGVSTFTQMAAMTPSALEDAVKSQKVRLVGSTETWPLQAELAAAGDFTALDELKGRIQGGMLFDDLTLIEGVGPKSQEVLHEAGFRTFQMVADATPDVLRSVLDDAGLQLLAPDTWPEQAKLLAENKTGELAELQDRLKGGRA